MDRHRCFEGIRCYFDNANIDGTGMNPAFLSHVTLPECRIDPQDDTINLL